MAPGKTGNPEMYSSQRLFLVLSFHVNIAYYMDNRVKSKPRKLSVLANTQKPNEHYCRAEKLSAGCSAKLIAI